MQKGRQEGKTAIPSLVENIKLSLEPCMHLTKFEKSTGIKLLPLRPTTDRTLWPDLCLSKKQSSIEAKYHDAVLSLTA